MGDAPQANGPDDAVPGTAPWERPQDWAPRPAEPTRVDELLSRLAADDEVGRRSRRRASGDDENTVPASDLIAALQSAGADESDDSDAAAAEPSVLSGPGSPAASRPASPSSAPSDDEQTVLIALPDQPADPEATVAVTPSATTAPAGPGTEPDGEATVLLPRLSEDPDAILASLRRNAGNVDPIGGPASSEPTGPEAGGAEPPHTLPPGTTLTGAGGGRRKSRGFLYAGRSAVAAVAAILMLFTGFEYSVIQKTEQGIQDRRISAVDTNDPNIKTPTANGNGTQHAAGGTTAPHATKVYQPENILLLGSDTRVGANGDASNGGQDATDSAQSDTLLIAHISGDRQHVTLVSIPRDLRVDAPLCKTWDYTTGKLSDEDQSITEGEQWKITNAYAVGGPKCTVKAVQQLTGLRIDRVIGIDFVGFKTMVDALGGIQVNVCKPIIDAELHTVIPTAGEQTLVGDQALNFVRARKVEGDPTGDLGRIRRQQIVLSAMLRQVVSAGTVLNPAKLERFLDAFVNSTYTDNVTVDSLIELAKSFGTLDPEKVTFYTLPTVPDNSDDEGALLLDPKAVAVFDALINDQTLPGETTAAPTTTTKATTKKASTSTATTRSAAPAQTLTVDPADVDLEVVNVAGRPGVAGTAQTALNAIGFDISDDDLTLPEDQPVYEAITVLYAPDNRAAALTVAAAVPGAILETQDGLGTRVRLLLGSSYAGDVTRVAVGDAVPASLRTTAADDASGAPSTETSSQAPSTDDTPSTGTRSTGPTLNSTDLSSVNAASTGCA